MRGKQYLGSRSELACLMCRMVCAYSCFDNCHHDAKKGIENPVAKKPATFIANTGFDFDIVNGILLATISGLYIDPKWSHLRPRSFRIVSGSCSSRNGEVSYGRSCQSRSLRMSDHEQLIANLHTNHFGVCSVSVATVSSS